ncbi:Nucleic acid-binding, OB-fold [Cynara cardunculus var. scolymus]|uniref:Nucleic acid-binding, OB-fold n=1 Tax=Cynara cardunculus var. scolymus TaxID=59895 RepID=A0A103YMA8_CYNCS|nr:Nucleic acid-binding, OB-fold [Cynara cardunculus var. scolymus]
MEFVGLQNLVLDNESWVVKIRICKLCKSLNIKRNGEFISLDMVLIDENGSLMTTMVRKNLVNKFNLLFKEGNVWLRISAFKVIDSNLKIIFTLLTKVEKIDTHVPSIPIHGFQLASEKIINDRLNDDNILTAAVGDVETMRGGFRKRDSEIISRLFKLYLSVRNDTGVVNCVVLHKLAERMVDSSPLKLLNKSDSDKDNLPHEITSLCG